MSHPPPTSELKKLACNWDLATLVTYQNKSKTEQRRVTMVIHHEYHKWNFKRSPSTWIAVTNIMNPHWLHQLLTVVWTDK
jgi:hypothetical protein